MKKGILIIGLLLFPHFLEAQLFSKERISNDARGGRGNIDNRLITWGYFLGFNSYDFKFDYNNESTDPTINTDILVDTQGGFNVGLIGDLRINKYINLRLEPGLYFTQRNLRFPGFTEERDALREVRSTYIHLPLLIKFSTKRVNNFKPFIVGGVSRSINLSSNENNPEDNNEGQFRTTNATNYFELGFGIDFYLFFFKFTPSIRGVFATSDELIRDDDPNSPWTSNINKLGSRGVLINFTFQ